eukprot:TRINITY_DN25376_c0_g1_i1.p1 TRINITY_DN25376_c0_g1~~TRINITY_DN25376_c0_g1_i1.p1  ORF type:complete len:429 (-),score=44.36 TRINITY_DN25376_c0_g1_i1:1122-2339(-)
MFCTNYFSSQQKEIPHKHNNYQNVIPPTNRNLSFFFKGTKCVRQSGARVVNRRTVYRVQCVDAAQPFDHEFRLSKKLNMLDYKIGIVGFGNFGQFLAARIAQNAKEVIATSRGDYSAAAAKMGVRFFQDQHDFCEEHPDIVILATSILSTEKVLQSLPMQRLRRNTLIVDVLSVKEFPKRLLLSYLPPSMDILCTHPMFGPDSGKGSWKELNFMFDKVRISQNKERIERVEKFLQLFKKEGCRMVEMTCERHDLLAASTQFITHTVGRVLGAMELDSTEINTQGFDSLLQLVNNTTNDSFDLYYGLFMYNSKATEELEKMETAFSEVKNMLMGRLHDSLRQQMFHTMPNHGRIHSPEKRETSFPPLTTLHSNGAPSDQQDFLKLQEVKEQIALPENSVQASQNSD